MPGFPATSAIHAEPKLDIIREFQRQAHKCFPDGDLMFSRRRVPLIRREES